MFSSLKSPYYQWTFLAGDNAIATLDNTIVNRDEKSTDPFVLTEETTIYVQKNGICSVTASIFSFSPFKAARSANIIPESFGGSGISL